MPLSIAFIGAGNMNRNHMKSAQALGLNMSAVADVNAPAAEEAKKDFGISKVYPDYRQLLADKGVEAVVIATPNRFHAETAIAALEAGKHVFLEKPMAMNVAECDRIIAARDKSGKTLQMGMVCRFMASVQTLKKFIEAGKCGKIYTAQASFYRRRGIPGFGGWFTTRSMSGGGVLIDLGVHMLDMSIYLMGFPKPVAVTGATYNTWTSLDNYVYTSMWGKPTPGGKKDVDDYAMAVVRFADGQTLQLNVSWALNIEFPQPEHLVRIIGDKAGVALQGLDHPRIYSEEAGHLTDTTPYFVPNNPELEEMRHFVEGIADRKNPMPSAEHGRTIQLLLDSIYKSSAEGREVRLDG